MGSGHFDTVLDTNASTTRIAMEITMTTCSKCHLCSSLLYDEEIMEGWSAENSNFNTRCTFCKTRLVPLLTVVIRDMRVDELSDTNLTPALSMESIRSAPPASQLLHHEGNLRHRTPPTPNRGRSLDRNVLHRSMDSDNAALFVFEDSPDSGSLAGSSRGGTPIDSPRRFSLSQDNPHKSTVYRPSSSLKSLNTSKDLIDFESSVSAPPSSNVSNMSASKKDTSEPYPGTESMLNEKKTRSKENLSDGTNPVVQSIPPRVPSSATSSGVDLRRLGNLDGGITLEPLSVPFLSPLVLRKEIEYVLDHEGDDCLTKPEFVDQHPIIYWNLVCSF
ncbi:DENN domain-containing protein 4C-like [Limulus polyphemus]|uniref:DENN domain-containing protein 4C-like n=1 Tax=Limulus polyphemus TaxID=6850 RepID=A0ABM1RVV2_LIMPO|nr:DENN domain-containing protein 4C-like [Limulus polyphemus]